MRCRCERSEAEKILQQLNERAAREYIDAILIAYIYVGLGQKDQAFAWLEKAYQERSGLMPWLKGEPKWDPLRGDARFADLVRRIGTAGPADRYTRLREPFASLERRRVNETVEELELIEPATESVL
jgi:hypothetical protein